MVRSSFLTEINTYIKHKYKKTCIFFTASVKVKAPMMKFVFGNLKCDDENAKENADEQAVEEQAVDEQAAKEDNEAPACG